jgi:hypothetical protein
VVSGIEAVELRILRRNTEAFIAADERPITLRRATPVPTGAGSTRPGTPVPLPTQTMRLLPAAESTSTERRLPDGTVVKPTWVLLGLHTADMLRGDVFTISENPLVVGEVVYVHEKRAYEVKGEVIARGPR